jgi:hypothetical protein
MWNHFFDKLYEETGLRMRLRMEERQTHATRTVVADATLPVDQANADFVLQQIKRIFQNSTIDDLKTTLFAEAAKRRNECLAEARLLSRQVRCTRAVEASLISVPRLLPRTEVIGRFLLTTGSAGPWGEFTAVVQDVDACDSSDPADSLYLVRFQQVSPKSGVARWVPLIEKHNQPRTRASVLRGYSHIMWVTPGMIRRPGPADSIRPHSAATARALPGPLAAAAAAAED